MDRQTEKRIDDLVHYMSLGILYAKFAKHRIEAIFDEDCLFHEYRASLEQLDSVATSVIQALLDMDRGNHDQIGTTNSRAGGSTQGVPGRA